GDLMFAVEYLPGQYDQRADSAAQAIQLLTHSAAPLVQTAKRIVLEGEVAHPDFELVKAYMVNPVESRLADLAVPETLAQNYPDPPMVEYFNGFTDAPDGDIAAMAKDLGLAMSAEDLLFCRDYFKHTEGRDPSITEIRMIDTYWSDHCRHTTFLTGIDSVEIAEGPYKPFLEAAYRRYLSVREDVYGKTKKPVTLMDLAVIAAKALKKKGVLDGLDESEEINACSIKIDVTVDGRKEPWLLMFKNETHNHPTEIEPFGGAATCLGGAIRDPLSGRSYVYQAMRVTGAADPRTPVSKTAAGKLPQRKICTVAARGYSSYGNQIGLATGEVAEVYHPGYEAKRMEIGAVIGAAPACNVRRERPEPGDVVILLGGRTGRDGIGGATGSSKAHTMESLERCGAEVQKGNPPTERKIQRLFRNPEATTLIKRCNDFGAGGVSVAIGELAEGLEINLDKVPKKYAGLDGTELAISESQERMAVVVAKEDAETFRQLAAEENLESVAVAVVTADPRLVMTWKGATIVDLSRAFLDTNGVTQHARAQVRLSAPPRQKYESAADDATELIRLKEALSSLSAGSRKGLSEAFDATIGSGTVLMPYGGMYQRTPAEGMAALIPVEKGTTDTVSL
ncbi:MAG: phosphoribosylformylglycinamidine synthase, partial [Acidobacteria bacterium]|nr:phosphoribosylformylglycinamidine synthase [Acidobacteriota bacterium]